VGIAFAVLFGIVDLIFFKQVVLLSLSFLIIMLAMMEFFQMQTTESYDDSFMGYDFSQGYTSLEKSDAAAKSERPVGLVARWRARRKIEKQRRLEEEAQQSEVALDAILAKVHERGLTSLTPAEKRLLKRASNRYRSKGPEPE